MIQKGKKTSDINKLAKLIVDQAVGNDNIKETKYPKESKLDRKSKKNN